MKKKKPFIIRTGWFYSGLLLMILLNLITPSFKFNYIIDAFIVIACVYVIYNSKRKNIILGIKEKDFREVLLTTLNELNLKYTDDSFLITITSNVHEEQNLQIIANPDLRTIVINKASNLNSTYDDIIKKLKIRLDVGDLEMDYKYISTMAQCGIVGIVLGLLYAMELV